MSEIEAVGRRFSVTKNVKNLAKFSGKCLCIRFFFKKVAGCNFVKEDSGTDVFV